MALQHSKKFKGLFWWSLVFILVLEAVLFRLAFTGIEEKGLSQCLWAFLISSSIPFSILLRLLIRVRPVVFSKFSLFPDHLEVSMGFKKMILKFLDLDKVGFTPGWSRFFRGYRLHHQSGQTVGVFSTLEKSDEILARIRELRPDLVSQKKFDKYICRMKLNQISWERLVEYKVHLKFVLINIVFVPLAFAGVTWSLVPVPELLHLDLKVLDWYLLVMVVHLILGMIINTFEERLVYLMYMNQVTKADFKRNLDHEKLLRFLSAALFWSISLALGVSLYSAYV